MTEVGKIIFYVILFYLYGSISFGYLATYFKTGKRLYESGTKNVGVANAFEVGGTLSGILAAINETSKGILPFIISKFFFESSLGENLLYTFCCIIGTVFPVFLGFKGGKGRTAFSWSLCMVSIYGILSVLLIWYLAMKITKNAILSYNVYLISLLPVMYILTKDYKVLIYVVAMIPVLYFTNRPERDDFAYYRGSK